MAKHDASLNSTGTDSRGDVPAPQDFHVFRRNGNRYLLDVERTAVFALGEEDYGRLHGYEASPSALTRELARSTFRRLRDLGSFSDDRPSKFARTRTEFLDACMTTRPRSMWLLVSQACNLRCQYCYGIANRYEDRGGLMTREVARAAVDLLIKRSGSRCDLRITFFGGEPALNMPVVRETVAYARDRTAACGKVMNFSMSTNGILLTDEDLEFCIENDFAMQFSLDGDREAHNLRRRYADGRGTYDDAVAAIRRYVHHPSHPPAPKVRVTMTPGNHDPLRISEHFGELGIDHYGIGSSQPCSEPQSDCDLDAPAMDELETFFEAHLATVIGAAREGQDAPSYNPFYRALPGLHHAARYIVGCGVGRNDTGVGFDGKLYPCHRYVGMEPYVLGDVWQGLDPARASAYYDDLYRAIADSCKECWVRNLCSGHCPWSRAGKSGEHLPPNPHACRHSKTAVERIIHLYFQLREADPKLLARILGLDREEHVPGRAHDTAQPTGERARQGPRKEPLS